MAIDGYCTCLLTPRSWSAIKSDMCLGTTDIYVLKVHKQYQMNGSPHVLPNQWNKIRRANQRHKWYSQILESFSL